MSVKNKYAPSQSCNNNNSERKERPRPTSVYLEPSGGRHAENSMWTFGINPKALFKRSSSDKIRLSKVFNSFQRQCNLINAETFNF